MSKKCGVCDRPTTPEGRVEYPSKVVVEWRVCPVGHATGKEIR